MTRFGDLHLFLRGNQPGFRLTTGGLLVWGLLVLSLLALWAGESSARELTSTPLGAVSAAKNCDWDARDYFQRSHPAQFGFFPVKGAPFTPGSYYVFVGPAGKDGRAIPPRKIKTFGPKNLRGGHNYSAIMADLGETLRWGEDSAQIMQFSKPTKTDAVALARNEADPAEWYAICLMPAGGAPPPLKVTVTPAEHGMNPGEEVVTTTQVSGGSPPYRYMWTNNNARSEVTKDRVRWRFKKPGSHIIRVVVTDSQGRTTSAQSAIVVRGLKEPLHVTVTPREHSMKAGEEVRTTANVTGGSPPYKYQWFNNDQLSNVTKNSVRWTLRKGGTHIIRVVVTDSQGKTANAQSVITVRGKETIQQPPVTPPKPPVTPTTPPTTPKQPSQGAWYKDGPPKIEKTVAKDTGAYFGHTFAMNDGSASGKMSWKTVGPNCSGTYNGVVTWNLPASMAGGSKVVVTATADTTHSNTCGYRNTGSGVHIGVTGLLRLDASCAGDAAANAPGRKVKGDFIAPQGGPGAVMTIKVDAEAPGGGGTAIYRYVWK